MNTHNTPEEAWRWQRPSYRRFAHMIIKGGKELLQRRPRLTWSVLIGVLLLAYIYRYTWHPHLLTLSIHAGAFGIAALFGVAGWVGVSMVTSEKIGRFLKPIGAICGIVLVVFLASFGREMHTYFAQYWRYQTLDLVELEHLPTSEHERTWALHGIYSFMRQQMNETETSTRPSLVRIGNRYDWTMGIEPTSPLLRYFDPVDEVVRIDSAITSFDLERAKNSFFDTGEGLLFSRNIFTCVQRRMWFWDALRYEPSQTVLYLKNDQDKWVQVVPMIRWRGYAFPRPEFGGVMVLEQTGSGFWQRKLWGPLVRVFWGCGTWISPRNVSAHQYLVGQNLVPYEVSRFMASSIRFQGGLWAPQKWRKEGDLRIPDLPDDANDQPFTMFFNMPGRGREAAKLYHYFGLEPSDKDKQALAVSLWVPADGIGPAYRYRHFGRSETLTGVSAVAGYVRSTRREYDWKQNIPVEHRPYLREIPDERGVPTVRFMWLTTVVTIDSDHPRHSDGSHRFTGTLEIAITDARSKEVVWVDRKRPEVWPQQLAEALARKRTPTSQ